MPATTVKIQKDKVVHLQFATWDSQAPDVNNDVMQPIRLYNVRLFGSSMKEFLEQGTTKQLLDSHEKFHRELRAKAAEEGTLVISQCTNPEWNPEGYTEEVVQ